jgi:hypothetical protein
VDTQATGRGGRVVSDQWLFSAGADVYVPLCTSPDVDLIADFGNRVDRVQVKTSTCWRNGRWNVTLALAAATGAGTGS